MYKHRPLDPLRSLRSRIFRFTFGRCVAVAALVAIVALVFGPKLFDAWFNHIYSQAHEIRAVQALNSSQIELDVFIPPSISLGETLESYVKRAPSVWNPTAVRLRPGEVASEGTFFRLESRFFVVAYDSYSREVVFAGQYTRSEMERLDWLVEIR